jgi:hypothetical protein
MQVQGAERRRSAPAAAMIRSRFELDRVQDTERVRAAAQ